MKNDPKARDFADKIEDTDIKKSVRAFVDFILVSKESPRSIALLGIARSVLPKNPGKNTNNPR